MIPSEKEQKIKEMAVSLLSGSWMVARVLARFCGLAISVHLTFPLARFSLQSLYDVLHTKRNWWDQLDVVSAGLRRSSSLVTLERWTGRALAPDSLPQIGKLTIDAFPEGWGATFLPLKDPRLFLARCFYN